MQYEFDQDTSVRALGADRYEGNFSDRWNIGAIPNGGYVSSVAMAALGQSFPGREPLTVTTHFLRPGAPGEVSIEVERIKEGKRFLTAAVRVRQAAGEVVRLLATYGDLTPVEGPVYTAGQFPVPADRDGPFIERPKAMLPAIAQRFESRLVPNPGEARVAEVRGWIRFSDGRPMDVHCLGLIADAFPPAVFNVTPPGWVPTVELTVHVRARPTGQWLACVFRTRFLFSGMLEEDGEMWDESGQLVALSRQFALAPRAM